MLRWWVSDSEYDLVLSNERLLLARIGELARERDSLRAHACTLMERVAVMQPVVDAATKLEAVWTGEEYQNLIEDILALFHAVRAMSGKETDNGPDET